MLNAELLAASIADNRASNARRDGQPSRSHAASSLADQNLARPTCDGAGIAPKSSNRRSVVRDTLSKRATSIGRNSNRFSGSDSATGTFGEHSTGGNRNLSKSTIAKTPFIESPVAKMAHGQKLCNASGEAPASRPPPVAFSGSPTGGRDTGASPEAWRHFCVRTVFGACK